MKAQRYWKRTHKYGIELPKSVAEALKIDERTGTDFWLKAIEKEMRNVQVAFEFRDDGTVPVGYSHVNLHMVFDVKLDLTRKGRLVANGNETAPAKEEVYSSVVSRDSVRLFFTLAALNDLEVLSCDIQNAYLSAPTAEKLWTLAGPEFGSNQGRKAIIVRALYGMRSSGARFRQHLAKALRKMGFTSCKADPDVWMRPRTKANGFEYYEYVITYVDDLACQSEDPKIFMEELASSFTLKAGSVMEPTTYLGADVKKYYIEGADDEQKARWALSAETYINRVVADVDSELALVGKKLLKSAKTPLSSGYRPEVDLSRELSPEKLSYYQGLIGVLRWICELGRVDCLVAVSLMSRYIVSAREGHLEQLFHLFSYLKGHARSALVFDDTEPVFDENRFHKCDWQEYYPDAAEAIPEDAPKPRGMPVTTTAMWDADHAGCMATRRSHTGVFVFVNRAPILWYSKRQNTVETSTFGSEIVALRTAIEMVEGLRYKLRMMGVEILGPTSMFGDNESVVKNTTRPESTLKKRHCAIAYHRSREAQAAGTCRIAHEKGETNLSDCLSKLMPAPRMRYLCSHILW